MPVILPVIGEFGRDRVPCFIEDEKFELAIRIYFECPRFITLSDDWIISPVTSSGADFRTDG